MNKLFALTFTSIISLNALAQKSQSANSITLTNQSDTDLVEKPISIATKRFQLKIDKHLFPQIIDKKGKEIPSQLNDLDGDGQFDELFFVADIPQKSSVRLALKWTRNQPNYPIKTSVRFGKRSSKNTTVEPKTSDTFYANQLPKIIGYQPYQTDGPSWENDKVAFRHYFDGRNAKDLFGKRTSAISPENVGISETGAVQDNYHVLKDWGRDILPAGNTEGRSIVYKGIAAVVCEAVEAGEAFGMESYIRGQIISLIGGNNELIDRFVEGSKTHAIRRIHEMEAVIEMLTAKGIDPIVTKGTRSNLEKLSSI